MLEQSSSDSSVNLELFHDDAAGKAENLGDLLADLVKALLVKEDILVQLVLYLCLGPGLLLGLDSLGLTGLSALGRARALIFCGYLCFSLYKVAIMHIR